MRTTLSIDDDSIKQVMQVTGEKSHPAAIRVALKSYLKQVRKEKLLAMRGQVHVVDNWEALREMDNTL